MYPVIAQIGNFSITSFGLFLSLSLFLAVFFIWRLRGVYDIDKEKTLDLVILTFFISFIGARLVHVALNFEQFDSILKIVLFNHYPGFSFWGGLISSYLALLFLSKRNKINFWLIADIAVVGLFIGLSLASLGCLLSACQYGVVSDLPIALTQIGLVEKRFPIQLVYAFFYLISFVYLWRMCLRFHFAGKVLSSGLVLLGLINFALYFFRGDDKIVYLSIKLGQILALLVVALGVYLYYRLGKRSIKADLKNLLYLFVSSKVRQMTLSKLAKSWYNLKVNWGFFISNKRKEIKRLLHVKSNPTQF